MQNILIILRLINSTVDKKVFHIYQMQNYYKLLNYYKIWHCQTAYSGINNQVSVCCFFFLQCIDLFCQSTLTFEQKSSILDAEPKNADAEFESKLWKAIDQLNKILFCDDKMLFLLSLSITSKENCRAFCQLLCDNFNLGYNQWTGEKNSRIHLVISDVRSIMYFRGSNDTSVHMRNSS